ncbi:MAG: GTP cyclohydrolase I FolE [Odoribacter sp.]|nr:GTP cyclohydrolase I FolE [Odoribacter sp.]
MEISKLSDEQRIAMIADHMKEIILLMGEDINREGLKKTPLRSAKALYYLTSGYRTDAADVIESALFEHEGSRVVIVKDIEFYSMCEHHVLPFFGTISIAYIPDGKIVGLSKLARVVNICARKLQVQERLTGDICALVKEKLNAKGVIVTCRAQHLCMKMRGVEKQNSSTLTVDYNGMFAENENLRREVLQQL